MNTVVDFEIKQLLYNKTWSYQLYTNELGRVTNSLAEQRWNE
jgi:hypothetical protein